MGDLDVLRYAREIARGGRDPVGVAQAILEAAGIPIYTDYRLQAPNGKFWTGQGTGYGTTAGQYQNGYQFTDAGRAYARINHLKAAMTNANRYWQRGPNPFEGCKIVEQTWCYLRSSATDLPGVAPIPPPRVPGDAVCHNCDRPGWKGKSCVNCGLVIRAA